MISSQEKIADTYTLHADGDNARHALLAASYKSGGHAPLLLTELEPPAGGDGERFYDRGVADVLAEVASWAYSDRRTLMDALYHRGIVCPGTSCFQISVSNEAMLVVATAFFIRKGDIGVLCFRGTEPRNAINFLTDATVETKDLLTLGHVHGGFHRNARAVWAETATKVALAIQGADGHDPLRHLYITGHSLGAAMAVIAAAIIHGDDVYADWRGLLRGVYTYGQPMVGDAEFARTCEERFGRILFRHVYGHDLVPRLPPLTTGKFKHFGSEYAGNEEGWSPRSRLSTQATTAILSIPIGAAAFVFQQLPLLRGLRLPYSLFDHSPTSYLEAFRAARA